MAAIHLEFPKAVSMFSCRTWGPSKLEQKQEWIVCPAVRGVVLHKISGHPASGVLARSRSSLPLYQWLPEF